MQIAVQELSFLSLMILSLSFGQCLWCLPILLSASSSSSSSSSFQCCWVCFFFFLLFWTIIEARDNLGGGGGGRGTSLKLLSLLPVGAEWVHQGSSNVSLLVTVPSARLACSSPTPAILSLLWVPKRKKLTLFFLFGLWENMANGKESLAGP